MREQTFPYDPDVLAGFPGARSYEHDGEHITYLAERGGKPYLIRVPRTPGAPVTVLSFDDEFDRATHLASRPKLVSDPVPRQAPEPVTS
ncbi:hypothetical protein [Spirillospora sp. CA-294931]|uniref:hypothetical protein n=1 Tax=Spirillospora sp. CA-294931 TaxID=3240042 RepID=UPI003D911752